MTRPAARFNTARFLEDHWQRSPCLLRGAFDGFDPPLDGDDLAGLACDELAEARIVRGSWPANDWQVAYGPFDEEAFRELGDTDWTLLVQDVEKHYPPARELMDCFSFLPSWRLDDLMVSFAAPGGSVGPHVDRYDVFLLQTSGRRRWGIATEFDPARAGDAPLDVLVRFEAEQEWVLEPGDMLYLPPGIAHHGVAVDPCLTWSVGLRAPAAADLLPALGEVVQGDESLRYADPGIAPAARHGEIEPAALEALAAIMARPLADRDAMRDFLAGFLSRYRLAHEPAPDPELPGRTALQRRLGPGARVTRNPWTRLAWYEAGGVARLFAAGTPYRCSISLAEALCGPMPATLPELDETSRATLQDLVTAGHIYPDEGADR